MYAKTNNNGNNVLDYSKYMEQKIYRDIAETEYEKEDLSKLYEIQIEANRKLDILISGKNYSEQQSKQRIKELVEENEIMKKKIKNSFPTHIIVYLVVCSLVFGVNLSLLILRFVFKTYTIDPYYIICALLITSTLFSTAVVAIKDWKEYITNAK